MLRCVIHTIYPGQEFFQDFAASRLRVQHLAQNPIFHRYELGAHEPRLDSLAYVRQRSVILEFFRDFHGPSQYLDCVQALFQVCCKHIFDEVRGWDTNQFLGVASGRFPWAVDQDFFELLPGGQRRCPRFEVSRICAPGYQYIHLAECEHSF